MRLRRDQNFRVRTITSRALAASEAYQRELSVRDHLTQLFNRRYLEETLSREILRSDRSHQTIGLILFDIDGTLLLSGRAGLRAMTRAIWVSRVQSTTNTRSTC